MKVMLSFLISGMFLMSTLTFSQGIGYKALVKDNSGNAITGQSITVQFRVLKGAGLTNVYQETHNPTTDANGFVMVNIGEGTVDSGVFADIDWGSDEHHLGVLIDTGGGWIDLGTTPFRAVPYALNVASEAMRINDLNDGKSDSDGTEDGSSIFLGIGAGLNDDGTDNKNVGIGFESLFANTIGYLNSSLGYQSLQNNSSGAFNSAIGASALGSNTSGGNNTAVGYQTLKNNTTGGNNTAMGMNAVFYNITGSQNVAIGNSALLSLESGFGNTAVGFDAGRNSTGDGNIYIGQYAGRYNTGSYRLFIESSDADPDNALVYGEFGTDNTTTGNIFRTNSEFQVGNPTLTGYAFPTADGAADQVLRTDGSGALTWSDDAQSIDDLDDARSDGSSIFLGLYAGLNDDNTDNYNLGIGLNSLAANNTGYTNTAIGTNTLRNNTTGGSNVGIGNNTLFNSVSGNNNTAVGFQVLYNNTTGFQNVGIGSSALNSIEGGSLNVALGTNAGYKTTGNSNIFVGHRAGYNELGSDKLYIENSSADANNALIYGEFNNNILRTNSQFQVGNPALAGYAFPISDGTADQVLRTNGNGSLSWDSLSEPSGLEALNEGNGTGYRLIGANPSSYGNIGSRAVDLSRGSLSTHGATGNNALAAGYQATASGNYSVAMGFLSASSGEASFALGYNNTASGDRSFAFGTGSEASGYHSTALGGFILSESRNAFAIGLNNVGGGSPNTWIWTDPLFEIGNGFSTRQNAMTVLKNGNTSFGINSPGSHKLYVKSAGTQSSGSTGMFENTASAGLAMVIQNTSSASIDNALLVSNHGTGPIASFDSWQGNNTWNRRFKFTNAGDGRCDGSWIGGGADYAEYFPKARNYDNFEPGDVIAMSQLTGYSVEMATTEDPRLIIGVYSSNPLVVGNSTAEEDPENHVLVGLMGVVSTKVNAENGPIAIGDFLKLSSTPGVAAKALESGYMIGRALESHSHSTQGMIKVLVEPEWMEFDKEMIAVTPELEQTLQELGYASHGFSAKDDQDQLRLPYNDLIVLLNKAIKVQQQRIEKQDSELSELKAWKERVDRLLGLAEN